MSCTNLAKCKKFIAKITQSDFVIRLPTSYTKAQTSSCATKTLLDKDSLGAKAPTHVLGRFSFKKSMLTGYNQRIFGYNESKNMREYNRTDPIKVGLHGNGVIGDPTTSLNKISKTSLANMKCIW